MMRTFDDYKKGEHVYVFSRDSRYPSYHGVVTSCGSKFITVREDGFDETFPGDKFEKNYGKRVDFQTYEIWHSEDEFNKSKEIDERINWFRRLVDISAFNYEEICTILDMYEKRKGLL